MVQSGKSSDELESSSEKSEAIKRQEEEYRIGWKMAGVGFEVTSEVAAGALIGWGIDTVFSTGTRWTLIGSIVGICVGLFSLIRGTLKLNKQLELHEIMRRKKKAGSAQPSNQEDS